MGGTTAKACLIEDGRAEIAPMMEAARVHRFKRGSGLPIKAPVIDMIEIGAGGGSIAAIDEVGLLRVGPASAGAEPGPACYGRGGTEPTVTDANLLLGYYDPGFFLGGRMALDRDAAERALAAVGQPPRPRSRSTPPGASTAWWPRAWPPPRASTSSRRARTRAPTRWWASAAPDRPMPPASRACSGCSEVLIPPASGAASALGFLAAPLSFEQVRSHPVQLDAPDAAAAIDAMLAALEREAARRCWPPACAEADMVTERSADMRLEGQMHEISVALPDGAITDADAAGDPRALRPRLRRPLHLGLWRASACRRSRSGCAAAGRCRSCR